MDHDIFIKSVRKSILYARIGYFGSALMVTGVMLQSVIVKKFWPTLSLWSVLLTGSVLLGGVLIQFYGEYTASKFRKNPDVQAWSSSLDETRRLLVGCGIVIAVAFLWILGLIFAGVGDQKSIDYRFGLSLCLCSMMWAMFLSELFLPRKLPKYEVA